MLWGKDKYLLTSLHEKLEYKISLKQMERINSKQNSKEFVCSKDKKIN